MDILFGLAVLALVGMAYYSHRQLERVKALNRGIHSRDAVIRKLRSQLNAVEGENLKGKAVYATISDIAFDVVVLLNEECAILACNTAAKDLFGDRNPIGKKLDDVIDALLWLAQELLDLSMIESGQSIMKLVKTPLKQIVDDAIERLGSQAEMKDLTIVSYVAEKYDVLCDADQLRRVLANLIHNAVKWSPPSEAITITANEQGDEIVISVFDNGPGVPDDLRERIFERFYQADVSRSGNEGTGLGLAICKHIIEAHGGRIRAEGNSHGKGGHFLFTVMKADTNFQGEALAADDHDSRIPVAGSFHPFR